MAFWNNGQIININEGTRPNDGTGDNIRDAFNKVDSNFGNISAQLSQFNQDWTNANVEFNFQATFSNITNSFIANATGTTSSFTGNSYSANIIANAGLYSSGVTYLAGNTYVSGNIIPTVDGVYNLGSPTRHFANLYVLQTVSTNQISQSTDAGILKIHANAFVGDLQDTGILGNITSDYNGANTYAFFGHQYTTNNFIYKITDRDTTSGNNIVVGGVYGNLQFGSGLFSNTTQSTSTTTGALIVAGGAGIAANLAVGGNVNATTNMYIGGSQVITTSSGGIGAIYNGTSALITGNIVYPSAAASISYLTGAIVVPYGGIGVFGNVTSQGGFVGSLYGAVQTAAQPNITSVGTLTGLSLTNGSTLNASGISATSIGIQNLTVTSSITATGVAMSGLFSISATTLTSTANTYAGNVIVSGNISSGYYLGDGSFLTGIPTVGQVQTLSANIGAYQIADSANVGVIFNHVNTLDANIGAYETWSNTAVQTISANLGTVYTHVNTLDANVGAYEISVNANIGGHQLAIASTNANIGAYQIATNANLGTATNNITTLFANAGAQQTQITSLYTSANVNTVAYFGLNSLTTTGITVPSITHSGTSGTGNIGAIGAAFNTVFATATTALYADLAEIYATDSVYEPGTVVIFGGSQEITTTTIFADARVAGAVSTNPAYLMNSEASGLPVALRGRIPVKVYGPVTKGDSLVTAGNAGFAVSVGTDTSYGQAVFAKAIETNTEDGEKVITAVII